MNIQEIYQNLLKNLELGHRSLMRFNKDELEVLNSELKVESHDHLEKVLTILIHLATPQQIFEVNLLIILKTELPPQLQIFALNASRKHIIEGRKIKGLRLEFDYLEILKSKLFHSDPEIVEWTLRTIDECGAQGVYFLREFDKIKPPPWKWFNKHQRAVREIITMLERRWSPHGVLQKNQPK
jgi:hypothetical protein